MARYSKFNKRLSLVTYNQLFSLTQATTTAKVSNLDLIRTPVRIL